MGAFELAACDQARKAIWAGLAQVAGTRFREMGGVS